MNWGSLWRWSRWPYRGVEIDPRTGETRTLYFARFRTELDALAWARTMTRYRAPGGGMLYGVRDLRRGRMPRPFSPR